MLSKLESRKECMEQIELIQHWNYFCSLAERLDDTKHYIDHGLQEHDGIRELVHGKVYSDIDGQFSSVIAESKDKEKYIEVIANNIIDGDIREILISPNVLNEVLDNSKQSRLFLDILLLLFLANKSKYDAETIEAEFKSEDSYYRMSLNITKHEPLFLYPLYDWILNNEEYENSYEIKLQVVRQVIVIKKDYTKLWVILPGISANIITWDDFWLVLNKKLNEDFVENNYIIYEIQTQKLTDF